MARWIENTASSAVKAAPSWNLTPGRSLKRYSVGETCSHSVARRGTTLKDLS